MLFFFLTVPTQGDPRRRLAIDVIMTRSHVTLASSPVTQTVIVWHPPKQFCVREGARPGVGPRRAQARSGACLRVCVCVCGRAVGRWGLNLRIPEGGLSRSMASGDGLVVVLTLPFLVACPTSWFLLAHLGEHSHSILDGR